MNVATIKSKISSLEVELEIIKNGLSKFVKIDTDKNYESFNFLKGILQEQKKFTEEEIKEARITFKKEI